ncbi:hypothetical protein KIN20_019860 [Parelaphostrongylus tenuis]|uniref:Uncharacterized protein n=1 Tax=Parelaphostrongylus tenuis TaxID=148309 RepID=A0AAD5MLN3_PARTN|nr:hypothetical protein KIN20_019860 [Parelaphostrongylus tenuis]
MGIGLRRTKPDFEKTELSNKTQQGIDCIYPPDSNTTVSTLSVNEYFAAKMAALKAKTEQSGNETKVDVKANVPNKSVDEEVDQYAEKSRIKKRKKKEKELRAQNFLESRMLSDSHEAEIEVCEKKEKAMRTTDKDERRGRKEEKKSRKREQLIDFIDEDSRPEVDCSDYGTIDISTEEKRTSEQIDKNKADNVREEIRCNAAKKKRKSGKSSEQ